MSMHAMTKTVMVALVGVASSNAAIAQEANGGWQWYYSAGVPVTNLDTSGLQDAAASAGLVISDEIGEVTVGGQGTLGVMVTNRFGTELRYSASANASGSVTVTPENLSDPPAEVSAKFSIDGFTLYGVGRYPLNEKTDVLGKVGYTFQELDADANLGGTAVSLDEDDDGVALGVGLRWRTADNWAVTAEIEYFAVDFDDTLDEPYRGSFNIEYLF